ncbi:hypothetical protein J6590_035518 [Homalodisca vitripennis]|nr:hypothetical protein J6590_035518 [Homalodisca vitripennis]
MQMASNDRSELCLLRHLSAKGGGLGTPAVNRSGVRYLVHDRHTSHNLFLAQLLGFLEDYRPDSKIIADTNKRLAITALERQAAEEKILTNGVAWGTTDTSHQVFKGANDQWLSSPWGCGWGWGWGVAAVDLAEATRRTDVICHLPEALPRWTLITF